MMHGTMSLKFRSVVYVSGICTSSYCHFPFLTYVINWISLSGNSQNHESHKQPQWKWRFVYFILVFCV